MLLALTSPFALTDTTPSAQESLDFKVIYDLYAHAQYEPALQHITAFEKTYPESAQMAQVENMHGLVFLLGHQPIQALVHFQKAISLGKQNKQFVPYVNYNLAKAYFEADQMDQAQAALSGIDTEAMDLDNQVKVHFLVARIDQKKGLPGEAARELLTASKLLSATHLKEKEANAPLIASLDESLKVMSNLPAIEALYQEFQDAPLADTVLFHLGSHEIALGNRDSGGSHLRTLIAKYPQSSYIPQAGDLLRSLVNRSVVDASAIGVLLPLHGKFSKFGLRSLQAIQLAFDIFNVDKPDSQVALVVEDSGEDVDQAVKALDRLVDKHHVLAVIGPLLSKGIDQISQRAQGLGVPLLSLARYPGVQGEWNFPAGVTLRQQIDGIARYSVKVLGLKKFAILHPQDKSGEESSDYFWSTIEALGGEIRGVESYGSTETDFRTQIDKLSGLYYTEARTDEIAELARSRARDHITKRSRKTEKYFGLPPIVDYQAVFIPDDPRISSQILPTFAYRDVDHMRFLGISSWDSPEFVSRAQSSAEGSLFTEAFYVDSEATNVRSFVDRFHTTYGSDPTSMEAQAYDAAGVLRATLNQSSSTPSRSDIRDRLKNLSGFSGVTGKISYSDHTLTRELKILTVKGGQIIPVTDAK